MADTLTLAQARSLWWKKQALGGGGGGGKSLASLIGSSGWLRTLGGSDVYLAARARKPGMTRAELDEVIASGELRVVPAARGCIYVVPSHVVGDLMALNAETWRKDTEKDLARAGSSMAVVEGLVEVVLDTLTTAMTTDALRKALPEGSIPSFGDAGKKVGLSSPLPLVLRMLELDGRVERTLERGRLDTERYLWRKAEWTVPAAAADPATQLANVIGAFLDFAGPCTLGQIAAWSGRAQRDLKPAIDQLGAKLVTVDGVGDAWASSGDIGAAMRAAPPGGIVLLASEDNYLINHGLAPVTESRFHELPINVFGSSKPEAIGKANHVTTRTIVRDGFVIGFWEVDPRSKGAVWHTFEPSPKPLATVLDDLTAEAARFLLDEIGHARIFSLDSMEAVQERADALADIRNGKSTMAKPPVKAIAAKTAKAAPKPEPAKPEPAKPVAPVKAPTKAKAAKPAKAVKPAKAKAKPAKAKAKPAKAKAKPAKAKAKAKKPAKPAKKRR